MAKPKLRWPVIYAAGAIIWIINSAEFIWLMPVFVIALIGCPILYRDTLRARAQWRHDRFVAWIKRPLPDPDDLDPNESGKVA